MENSDMPPNANATDNKVNGGGRGQPAFYNTKVLLYRVIQVKLDVTKQLFQTENNQWGSKMGFVHVL